MDELRGFDADPPRDRTLSALLGASETGVPAADSPRAADWTALHARILDAAGSALAERRSSREPWWSPIARWSPVALPVGAVAAAALAIGLSLHPAASGVAAGEVEDVEDVIVSGASETPSGALLFASSSEAFATAALETTTDQ
ncbi:MAG: hypothetical protein ACREOU_13380 [Candidatus Eiseniibacteriota bacterium]